MLDFFKIALYTCTGLPLVVLFCLIYLELEGIINGQRHEI